MDVYKTVAVVTANLGGFDNQADPVDQSVDFDFYRFTDDNFPPRYCTMQPRLQARIVKLFAWQMIPQHGTIIWVDSSCQLSHRDSVSWLLEQAQESELTVFKHPNRATIGEEADYLRKRLDMGCPYITPRYDNELLDEQMEAINNPMLPLYASTVLVYRPTYNVKRMMTEWWYHVSRFHAIDQLSLPYVIDRNYVRLNVIDESYLKVPYLKYVRK